MKKIITALLLLAASQIVVAGTFNYKSTGNVLKTSDLGGKLSDLVTDKFTEKYPYNKWTIYVQTSTGNSNSDGSALYFVSVGVGPTNLNGIQPANRTWENISRDAKTVNVSVRDKKPYIVEVVRAQVLRMMDECEKSPNCDIDK